MSKSGWARRFAVQSLFLPYYHHTMPHRSEIISLSYFFLSVTLIRCLYPMAILFLTPAGREKSAKVFCLQSHTYRQHSTKSPTCPLHDTRFRWRWGGARGWSLTLSWNHLCPMRKSTTSPSPPRDWDAKSASQSAGVWTSKRIGIRWPSHRMPRHQGRLK